MRILTWNIHGASFHDRDERFPVIKKAIEEAQPDTACIQEAFFSKGRKMLESVEGYQVSYQTNWYPIPKLLESTKGGLVTLTKAKPLEVNYHPYLAQGTWFTEQRWDRLLGKGFLETIIEDQEFGKTTIINTHKISTYKEEDDTDDYIVAQAQQLLVKIKELKAKGGAFILAGDMNFRKKSSLYPQFRELLHDAAEDLHDAAEDFHNLHLFEYATIDYIFSGDRYHCQPEYIRHESWGKYPSDHPGIVIDIKPKR